MNIPNFKNLVKKLSVIRTNSSLLLPIGIGLLAVVLFIPNQLLSGRLKQQIESDSVNKGKSVQSIEVVPREQLEQKEKYHERYAQDANQIALLSEQTTKRELLSYEIFLDPNVRSTSALIFEKFGQQFRGSVNRLLTEAKAGTCPTDAELDRSLQQSPTGSRMGAGAARRSLSGTSRTMQYYGGYGYGKAAEINRTIVEEICLERAKSASVYTLATDLSGYEFWAAYKYSGVDEAVKDCWYWQLGYWVIEDVVNTVNSMNSGSKSVFTSPVKRLINVSFSLGDGRRRGAYTTGFRRGSKQADTGEKPRYVRSVEDAFIVPCTQRYCDDYIDVIHFRVRAVVGVSAVLPFMKELCSARQHKFKGYFEEGPDQTFKHNQITILESTIKAVDPESQDHYYYRYGEDAAVELDLIGEYVFNKAGYEPIKPQAIKDELKAEIKTGKR
jgi:hypothetical protein